MFQGLLGITDEDIGYCEPMSITVHRGRTAPPGERPVHSPNNNSIAKNACDIEAADGGGASHANNAVNTSSIRGCETVGRNCPDDEDNIGRSNCGTVTGKKERRATYLGRSQKFPLRQVQSLAVSDRRVGFGGVTGTSSGKNWQVDRLEDTHIQYTSYVFVYTRYVTGYEFSHLHGPKYRRIILAIFCSRKFQERGPGSVVLTTGSLFVNNVVCSDSAAMHDT